MPNPTHLLQSARPAEAQEEREHKAAFNGHRVLGGHALAVLQRAQKGEQETGEKRRQTCAQQCRQNAAPQRPHSGPCSGGLLSPRSGGHILHSPAPSTASTHRASDAEAAPGAHKRAAARGPIVATARLRRVARGAGAAEARVRKQGQPAGRLGHIEQARPVFLHARE